jgi:hypothetical protein
VGNPAEALLQLPEVAGTTPDAAVLDQCSTLPACQLVLRPQGHVLLSAWVLLSPMIRCCRSGYLQDRCPWCRWWPPCTAGLQCQMQLLAMLEEYSKDLQEPWDDDSSSGLGLKVGTQHPLHQSKYHMVRDIVVACSTAVPEVYKFPTTGPSFMGAPSTQRHTGPRWWRPRPFSTPVLGSMDCVERNGPSSTLKKRTSMDKTCGRLSKPLIIVLCAGSPHKVAVDCYGMRNQADVCDLLVGTPFINAMSGCIISFYSSFIYMPQLHAEGSLRVGTWRSLTPTLSPWATPTVRAP